MRRLEYASPVSVFLPGVLALFGALACGDGAKPDTTARTGDDGATPSDDVAIPSDDGATPSDDVAMPNTTYAVPGSPCKSAADCNFDPDEVFYGPNGVCAPTQCGEPTCHDFVPCAAPSEPVMVCTCEGTVAPGTEGCDRISNYAFSLGSVFDGTTFVGGCGDSLPEEWSVRLEVTGWEDYEGTEVTITGSVAGDNLLAAVVNGAISLAVNDSSPIPGSLVLFFDANGDGECNDRELSFTTVSTVNAATAEVVLSPVTDGVACP